MSYGKQAILFWFVTHSFASSIGTCEFYQFVFMPGRISFQMQYFEWQICLKYSYFYYDYHYGVLQQIKLICIFLL